MKLETIASAASSQEARGATLVLDESERQLVLLALATLALRSPGFDDALNRIAVRLDNVVGDRAELYDQFRALGPAR
jgi:hypothetical protein